MNLSLNVVGHFVPIVSLQCWRMQFHELHKMLCDNHTDEKSCANARLVRCEMEYSYINNLTNH